jgi:uncharacterized protein (TIGR02594 family)
MDLPEVLVKVKENIYLEDSKLSEFLKKLLEFVILFLKQLKERAPPPPPIIVPEVTAPEPVVIPPPQSIINTEPMPRTENELPWIKIALQWLGLKEVPGAEDNPDILKWAKDLGGNVAKNYTHDSIPWCGLFMAITQKLGNNTVDNEPLWAKSWADYGTNLREPAYGCIMVFSRHGGGHVGYYVSEDDKYFHVLGGNQSDSVSVVKIDKSRLIACRWPPNADEFYRVGRVVKAFDGQVSTKEA